MLEGHLLLHTVHSELYLVGQFFLFGVAYDRFTSPRENMFRTSLVQLCRGDVGLGLGP